MSKDIVLKNTDGLGGKIDLPAVDPKYKEPDYSAEGIKNTLAELNIEPVKQVEVTDPITGKKSLVTIDRTGTSEAKLITALADPNLKRDQKDHVLSMYLWERGSESVSMLVDLMRYKGSHTKESRAFMSQSRFDFEQFITLFCEHMKAQARDIADTYSVKDVKKFCDEYLAVLAEAKKENTTADMSRFYAPEHTDADVVHIRTMVRNWTEAERFEMSMRKVAEGRDRQRGYGIYIGMDKKPYSIFEDQGVDEIVKRDYERIKELENEDE